MTKLRLHRNGPYMALKKCKPYLAGLSFLTLAILAVASIALFKASDAIGESVLPEQVLETLENALTNHRAELSNQRSQMEALAHLKDTIQKEIDNSEYENIEHKQLLLVPQVRIESLENALINNRQAYRALAKRLSRLQRYCIGPTGSIKKIDDNADLARKRMAEIKQSPLPDAKKKVLEASLQGLIQVLEKRGQLLNSQLQICENVSSQVNAALEEKKSLDVKLEAQLKRREKVSVFTPSKDYQEGFGNALREELSFFETRFKTLLSPHTWRSQWNQIKAGSLSQWLLFSVWLTLIVFINIRLQAILQRIQKNCDETKRYYRGLTIFLLRRSFLYLGLAILFGTYGAMHSPLFSIGLGRFLSNTFLVLLFTRWGLDYLKYAYPNPSTTLQSFVSSSLKRLIRFLRVIAIALFLLIWMVGINSLLVKLMQDTLLVVLIIWTWTFWGRINPAEAEAVRKGRPAPYRRWIMPIRAWSYLLIGSSLFISILGYHDLAEHWFSAWIKTTALLFWGWIARRAIKEWQSDLKQQMSETDKSPLKESSYQLQKAAILISRLAWYYGMAVGMIWAWDRSGELMSKVRLFYDLSFTIGSINISIRGIVHTIIILLLAHVAVQIGKSLIKERVLDKKILERGFKDSILKAIGYMGWGGGIILALASLGVDATSLAVIFGALSVGIGIGLQNIFNNFVSGLILLFERPIQVGDMLEINGVWAEVKKINVRATVVQTLDNASLIIPNSEFISKQVTNWSFKDARTRHNIDVGVAYGSDIDLVEKTLLEIAKNDPKVLYYPKPDVVFVDHAASSMLFRLRIWIYIADYWGVLSRIRSGIDRRFRELSVEIAFPQQDVHLRTIPKEITPSAFSDDLNGNTLRPRPTAPDGSDA